ncbi:MAG: hypothetical protein AAGG38_06480 [Planctomycetota bacterium]
MHIGEAPHQYIWHEDWAKIPDTPSGRNNGRTHGVAVLKDGRVVVFNQAVPGILFFDPDGKLVESWGDRFTGAHGLSLVEHDGEETFWLTDQDSCEVCHVTLDGELIQRLDPPPIDQRPDGKYKPTWADQNPANGDVWVGDGYGGFAVFRYAADGTYLGRILGDEPDAAGCFFAPHCLAFSPAGELWITDRGNHRLCVYDGEGKFLRHSNAACHSPCDFAFHDGLVIVPELFGAVKILDQQLNVVAELGANANLAPAAGWESLPQWVWPTWVEETQWPNVDREAYVKPGVFNSPHGIAAAPNGDLYVVEWIVGGRITKLEKA